MSATVLFGALSALPANGPGSVPGGVLGRLFSERYLPHRFCYLAQPGLVWSNAISDTLIALSYVALFAYLMFVARRVHRIAEVRQYAWILVAFGAFILSCAATHFMEVVTVWWPFYPISAVLKVICAAVSVPTAIYFSRIAPALADGVASFVRARAEAIESTERFRFLAETMPQLVFTLAPQGEPQFFNQRWLDYTGTSAERANGADWKDALHPEDAHGFFAVRERSIAAGREFEHECRLRRASDGSYRWHLVRVSPRGNAEGAIVQWIGTGTDIEGQKRKKDALEVAVLERTAELLNAQQRLQALLDGATNVSVIATDAEGLITVFNTGAQNMLGYTADEMVGKQTPAILHLESEAVARGEELTRMFGSEIRGFDVFVEMVRRRQSEEREWTYVRKDGGHVTVNLVVTCLRDATQEIAGFLGIAMDMTARNKAEGEARASAESLRLIVETVRDYALILVDTEGKVASWNAGAERVAGYTAEEIIGQSFSKFYPSSDREHSVEDELQLAVEQGSFTEVGWRMRKDGTRFLADVLVAPIRDDTGGVTGFAKVIRDISERKQAEERFQLVVEASPSGLLMVGSDGLIRLVNAQTERLFGYDRSELLGRPVDILVPGRFRSGHGSLLAGFFAAPSPRAMGAGRELFGLRMDGKEIPIEIGLNPIETSEGEMVLASVLDVSERKMREREAIAYAMQLKMVNKELEEFAYVASHDLKAPLRVIDNASKWLEEDLAGHLTGDAQQSLGLMRSRIRRMEKLLDDLLEYSRVGRFSDSSYNETVTGEVLMADTVALLNKGAFHVEIGPGFAKLRLPRMPLQQIMMNLIGNAIKHHDQTIGTITVTVEDRAEAYLFAVSDDGPGIPPQFHEQIFKMFQTLKPRDQVEGSGMGLAMVRKHVQVRGGVLEVESGPGRGTTFRFTWPKLEPKLQAERKEAA